MPHTAAANLYDESGRFLAGPQDVPVRPAGPWDTNTDARPLRSRCAWCAVKHPTDGLGPILDGDLTSDGMCDVAIQKWHDEMDALEAERAG